MKHGTGRRRHAFALLAGIAALCPGIARAQSLAFTFSSAAQSGAPGTVLHYSGTVRNLSGTTVYLTFDSLSLTPASVATADDSVFFNNVTVPYFNGTPVAIANAASYTLPVFDVTIAGNAATGAVANGVFSVQANSSADPNNPATNYTTADALFSAMVVPSGSSSMPDAPTLWTLGTGLLFTSAARLRRKNLKRRKV